MNTISAYELKIEWLLNNMKTIVLNINKVKVWLMIQQFFHYENGKTSALVCNNEYTCYFKFSEPTGYCLGELILDESRKIKLFKSIEDAEVFAMEYIEKKIRH